MAFETEVYTGKINIETNGVQAAQQLFDKLTESAAQLKKAMAGLDLNFKVSGNSAQAELTRSTKAAKEATDGLVASQKKLADQAKSDLLPAIAQITAGLAQLPNKATPEYFILQQRLKELKQELSAVGNNTDVAVTALGFNRLGNAIDVVTTKQRELKTELQQTKVDNLVNNLSAIQSGADKAFRTPTLKSWSLLLTTSGARLQGLREIMAGTSTSTNVFVRALDSVIRKGSNLDQLNGKLNKSIYDISRQSSQAAQGLGAQTEELKKLVLAETGSQRVSQQVAQGLNDVKKAYQQVTTTARSGGDIDKAMARARTAVEEVQFSIKSLINSGLIPAGTQSAVFAEKLLDGVNKNLPALQAMAVRYKATKDEVALAKEEQKKQNVEVEKSVSVFGRLKNSLAGLVGVSRNNSSAIKETEKSLSLLQRTAGLVATSFSKLKSLLAGVFSSSSVSAKEAATSIQKVDREVNVVVQSATRLKDIFLGVFGGNLLSGLVFRLSNALGGLGREFVSINDLVQNTEITLRGMLEGSGVDAEAAVAGFQAFIKKEVASTPFEIADATEASLRLIQQGFDPKDWFRASANAAAAMNKPMEQFISGLTKLMAGSRGIAVDMFRDFGLNVNNISGVFDKATGKALTFKKAQDALKLSAVEFDKQYTKLGFEFDKQGSLVNDTGEALDILNAYLMQNATFATAAEARSKSLSGVWSNFKDSISNLLIIIGQPIFDKLTIAATGLLEKLNVLQPVLEYYAQIIGQGISSAIDWAIMAFTNFQVALDQITAPLQGIGTLIQDIIYGNWNQAWQDAVIITADAMTGVIEFLDSFASNANTWGYNFVVQITDGIIEAANTVLMDAISSITETISNFLAPGSPPKEGPLSNIDKWGQGVMEVYTKSMGEADISFVTKALDDIAFRFEKFADKEEGLMPFQSIRGQLTQLVSEMGQTGQINEQLFSEIENTIRAAGDDPYAKSSEELVKNLREQLVLRQKLTAAQEGLTEVNKEIAAAEAAGYIPAELIEKQRLLQEQTKAVEDQVTEEDKKQKALEELYGLDEKVYTKKDKAKVASAKAAGAAMAKAAKKTALEEFEAWKETYQKELAALEEKKKAGIITEEEYLKEVLKLKEQYVDKALAVDSPEDLGVFYSDIKDLQSQLEKFQEERKLANKKSAAEIFQTWSDNYKKELAALDDRFAQGELSEKEYYQKVLKLKQDFVQRALKAGLTPEALQEEFAAIEDLKTKLEGISDSTKKGFLPPSVSDILGDFGKEYRKNMEQVGTTSGQAFVAAIKVAAAPRLQTAIADLKETAMGFFDRIRTAVQALPQEFIFPFSVIAGIFAQPILEPLFNALFNIGGLIRLVGGSFSWLGGILTTVAKITLRWSVYGFIVYGVITRWDEVVQIFNETIGVVINQLIDFGKTTKTIISTLWEMGAIQQTFYNLASAVSYFGLILTQIFGLAKKLVKGILVFITVELVGGTVGAVQTFIEAFGGAESFAISLGETMVQVSSGILALFKGISEAIAYLFSGDFQGFMDRLAKIPGELSQYFNSEPVVKFAETAKAALISMLPPEFVANVVQARDAMTNFLNSISSLINPIITDVKNLTNAIVDLGNQIGPGLNQAIQQALSGDFSGAIQTLKDTFTNIDWTDFQTSFTKLFNDLDAAIGPIITKIAQNIWGMLPPETQSSLITAANTVKAAITEAFNQAKAALDNFFTTGQLGGELVELWNQLVELFKGGSDGASASVGALTVVIGGLADILISVVQTAVDILPTLSEAVSGVVNVFDGMITIFQGTINEIISLGTFISGFVTGDVAKMDQGARDIRAAFDTIIEGMGEIFTGLLGIVTNTGGAIIKGVGDFVANLVKNFAVITGNTELYDAINKWKTDFDTGFNNILSQVTTTLDQLETILGTGTEGLKALFKPVLDAIVGFFVTWGEDIVRNITTLGTRISELLHLEEATKAVTDFINGILGFFSNLYTELVGASIVPDTIAGIITEFAKLPGEVLSTVAGMVTDILAEFTGLGGKILGEIPNIISDIGGGFFDLGKSIVGKIKEGIGGTISSVGSSIKSFFTGGGQDEAAAAPVSFDTTQVQSALDAIKGQMGTFQSGTSLIFGVLSTDWQTNTLKMTTDWTTFITAITTAWTTFKNTLTLDISTLYIFLQTNLTNTLILWQTTLTTMTTLAQATGSALTEIITVVSEAITAALDTITAKITGEVDPAFVSIGEVAQQMADDVEEGIDKTIDALDDLLDALDDVISSFEEMAKAAQSAAGAAGGALTTGGGSMPSAALGAERTSLGLWMLHPDEMVLPKYLADPMRAFFKALPKGIGNTYPSVPGDMLNLPTSNLIGANPNAGGLRDVGAAAGASQQNIFNTNIYDQMDEALFKQKVLRWVAGEIR